jgi:hypothetical protein
VRLANQSSPRKKIPMKALLAILALAMLGCTAAADSVTYSYCGPSPADLSGSFTVSAPLVNDPAFAGLPLQSPFVSDNSPYNISGFPGLAVVLSYSFTDGAQVWNSDNTSFDGGMLMNADGSVGLWHMELLNPDLSWAAFSDFSDSLLSAQDHTTVGDTLGLMEPGTWAITTDPVSTPEPGTLSLLCVGLVVLTLRKRKKQEISANWETLA